MPMCFARPPATAPAPIDVVVRIVDEPAPMPVAEKQVLSIDGIAYQGVWREGREYKAGQFVTFGGSMWHADRDTDAKPNTPDSGYTLAVKRGRDGKGAA